MKSFSVRLSDAERVALRRYADTHQLPLGTALKRLLHAGLAAQKPAPPSDRPLLEQCLTLLQLQSLYQLHAFHRSWLDDQTIPSSQRRWTEAASLTNRSLDRDPALFGNARFTLPDSAKSSTR